jgi:hypothetical protein
MEEFEMTIASIIGQVDVYSACVAVVALGGATIVATAQIAKYQNRRKTDQQFELEKLKLHNADAESARTSDVNREVKLGQIAANRQVEIARIEGGMVDVKNIQPAE